jgi:hypothetical protein
MELQMTQEDLMDLLVALMDLAVWLIIVAATVLAVGFTAGYFTERFALEAQAQRTDRCINSACDGTQCKSRFVRHQGCEK